MNKRHPFRMPLIIVSDFYLKREFRNSQLSDERLPTIRSLLQQVTAWDEDIRVINRLLHLATLELITAADILPLVDKLRSDEAYLLKCIEYADGLLTEGELGTVHANVAETAAQTSGRLTDRLVAIADHKTELRELSQRQKADLEVAGLT